MIVFSFSLMLFSIVLSRTPLRISVPKLKSSKFQKAPVLQNISDVDTKDLIMRDELTEKKSLEEEALKRMKQSNESQQEALETVKASDASNTKLEVEIISSTSSKTMSPSPSDPPDADQTTSTFLDSELKTSLPPSPHDALSNNTTNAKDSSHNNLKSDSANGKKEHENKEKRNGLDSNEKGSNDNIKEEESKRNDRTTHDTNDNENPETYTVKENSG